MKALILAAGLGSRLKSKTADRPKAMVEIIGKPVIQHQLESLIKVKVHDVIIVIGYKGQMVKDFVIRVFPDINVTFVENIEFATTNSSFSFWCAKDLLLGQSYLHLNCDNIFSFDLLNRVKNSQYPNVIAVRKDLTLGDKMENVVLDGDRIVEMSIINTQRSVGKAFGLAKFSPESTDLIIEKIRRYIEKGDKNQNYYGMIREAVKELEYRGILTDKYNLAELNTLEDHEVAESTLFKDNFLLK